MAKFYFFFTHAERGILGHAERGVPDQQNCSFSNFDVLSCFGWFLLGIWDIPKPKV